MLKGRYFTLLVPILFLIIYSSDVFGINDQMEEKHSSFINSFKNEYNSKSNITEVNSISKKSTRLKLNGLKSLKIYHLKSKDQIKGKKGYYLKFRLSVYNYSNSGQSELAFVNFKKKIMNTVDYMRSKSPMLSLLNGNSVYILDGSCLYSRKNMDKLEQKMINVLFPNGLTNYNFFLKKICGGRIIQ